MEPEVPKLIESGLVAASVLIALFGVVGVLRWLNGRPRRGKTPVAPRRPGPVRRRRPSVAPDLEITPRSVVVDGSNVMFWADNTPTAGAVQKVLSTLREAGKEPILCFDANIGYKLANQHLDRGELALLFGIPQSQVVICPSRTDGDAMIMRIATENRLPVVSNDRYRDYPDLVKNVRLMPGSIVKGEARVLLNPRPPRGS
jgi:hypothetical protein